MSQYDVATQIWQTMKTWGCSDGAVAGILGNMQAESGLIPDRWQSDRVGNNAGGYGLVQWTPATKYRDWAQAQGLNPADLTAQMARIKWEADHGQQFYKTGTTFWAWLKSDHTPEQAADDFVRYYERPAVINSTARQQFARTWYNQLHGLAATPAPSSDVDAMAAAVFRGVYGDGDHRKQALGDWYDAVQARVNQIDTLAHAVITGQYGNGQTRKDELGPDYQIVQDRVNQILEG